MRLVKNKLNVDKYDGIGIAIGVGFGLIFGTMLNNIALGIAIGATFGLIFGQGIKKNRKT